jgi:hypothetical protein
MSNITNFPAFTSSYKKLKEESENKLLRIFIEFYHHDFQSEPFMYLEGSVQTISMEEIEEHGKVINIITSETILSFTERNYHTNISGDAVVFSSKDDNETYCIIEFI